MGAYGHPLRLTKHAFFVLYMYSRLPNIQGGIQTYGGVQTYGGHPNIKGTSKLWVESKHMGASKHTRGIQTYGMEGIQTYRWPSKHTVGVSKHMGD